jgi:hypothetical protein
MIQKLILVLFVGLLPTSLLATTNAEPAAVVFNRLTSLIGSWEGKRPDGRPHTVSYRLTAGGSVLVETWTLSSGRESMTMYHLDGDILMATHYCPQGNQPRLQLVPGSELDKFSFVFRDGTNLQVKEKSHQHSFSIKLSGTNSFERSETYVENGSTAAETATTCPDKPVVYTRIVPVTK